MSSYSSVKVVRERSQALLLSRALRGGLAGGLLAAVGNIGVLLAAQALQESQVAVPMGPGGPLMPLGALQVALVSILPALVAGLFLWFLARWFTRPLPVFWGVALVIMLVSFVPLSMPGLPESARPVLAVMHVVAGASITAVLSRFASKKEIAS